MGISTILAWALCLVARWSSSCNAGFEDKLPANQETLFSDTEDWLFKRDTCSDAFGAGARNSICAPSNTLCCTRTNQTFPSCQQFLGKGWCCVGNNPTDQCYVDQASDCTDANSIACTNTITDGSKEVCCPRLTSCVPGYTFTSTHVRCQIQFVDLQKLAASSASSSSQAAPSGVSSTSANAPPVSASSTPSASNTTPPVSTPASSSTVPVPATTTPPQTQQTQTRLPESSSSPQLPLAAIAGISVGLTLAVVVAATFLVLYLRSRRKAKSAGQQQQPVGAFIPTPVPYKTYDEYGVTSGRYATQVGSYLGYAPQEAADTSRHNRLPSAPVEMEGTSLQ